MNNTAQIEPVRLVSEFIKAFGASLDPRLWMKLAEEELDELEKADAENEGREAVLKEYADVLYVAAGLYLTAEHVEPLFTEEDNARMDKINARAEELVEYIVNAYGFKNETFKEAFRRVHASNMSKLDDNGKPIRREDGKVLKGPNYKAPDLSDLV